MKIVITLLLSVMFEAPFLYSQSNLALGSKQKFELIIRGSDNYVSNATTNQHGLTSNYSGKKNIGVKIGFTLFKLKKAKIYAQTGMMYRDYGFKENNSVIPYFTIPLNLQIRFKLFWRFSALVYTGGEFARCHQARYSYPVGGESNYNLFLHQNDALIYSYGGGIGLTFNRFGVDVVSEYSTQFDSYDRQYGKTLGSRALGLEIRYQLF